MVKRTSPLTHYHHEYGYQIYQVEKIIFKMQIMLEYQNTRIQASLHCP